MSSRSLHVFFVSLPHSICGWPCSCDHQPWLCEGPSPVPGHPQQIHSRYKIIKDWLTFSDDILDDVQEQVSAVGPAAGRAAPLTCLSVDTCTWNMSQIGRTGTSSCPQTTQVRKAYLTSPLSLNFNVITVQTFTIAFCLIYSCIKWIDHKGSVHPHTSL